MHFFILSSEESISPVVMDNDCVRLMWSRGVAPEHTVWEIRDNSCTALAQLDPTGASLNLWQWFGINIDLVDFHLILWDILDKTICFYRVLDFELLFYIRASRVERKASRKILRFDFKVQC